LQPPRRRHGKAGDFADDGPEAAMAQSFLHAGEHRFIIPSFEIDHAIACEARLSDPRRE
jgi:hypothetical protein